MKIEEIISLYKDKNFSKALDAVNSFLKNNIKNSNAYNLKGTILRSLGRRNESLECYDKAIKINPKDPNFYNNKANTLRDLKKFTEAESFYKKCLNINNKNLIEF